MSNYEWQKQYSRQKIASRMREADLHRLANSAPEAPPRRNPLAGVLRAIIGLLPARRRAADPQLFHSEHKV